MQQVTISCNFRNFLLLQVILQLNYAESSFVDLRDLYQEVDRFFSLLVTFFKILTYKLFDRISSIDFDEFDSHIRFNHSQQRHILIIAIIRIKVTRNPCQSKFFYNITLKLSTKMFIMRQYSAIEYAYQVIILDRIIQLLWYFFVFVYYFGHHRHTIFKFEHFLSMDYWLAKRLTMKLYLLVYLSVFLVDFLLAIPVILIY